MQISNLPVPLKIESLQSSIKDVYAKDIEDWTDNNLSGKDWQSMKILRNVLMRLSRL